MRIFALLVASVLLVCSLATGAEARVRINVNLASQTMHVSSAAGDYVWPISSARSGFRTPRGTFGVQSLQAMHHSKKYHNSPMPHSIFFSGGYAIHGTYATGALGRPASHGCIRISPGNAAALFQMVQAEGASIAINGSAPDSGTRYARQDRSRTYAARANTRVYAQHGWSARGGYAARSGYVDPYRPLGYAPVVAPSFYQWMADPVGY